MSYAEIKKAINSNLSVPLNEIDSWENNSVVNVELFQSLNNTLFAPTAGKEILNVNAPHGGEFLSYQLEEVTFPTNTTYNIQCAITDRIYIDGKLIGTIRQTYNIGRTTSILYSEARYLVAYDNAKIVEINYIVLPFRDVSTKSFNFVNLPFYESLSHSASQRSRTMLTKGKMYFNNNLKVTREITGTSESGSSQRHQCKVAYTLNN